MSKQSDLRRALLIPCLLLSTTLALPLLSACVTRPVAVNPAPPQCPQAVLDELLSDTPGANLPGPTFGEWVTFSVQTEAARLSGNRDKQVAKAILADCRARYAEATKAKRKKFLWIF